MFKPIKFQVNGLSYNEIRSRFLTNCARMGNESIRELQRMKFGKCQVDVPRPSVAKMLIFEVLNPFYIFQIVAVAVWIFENYYSYASCIFAISTASALITLYENMQNQARIREMAHYNCRVKRMDQKGDFTESVDSTELVPGDVI